MKLLVETWDFLRGTLLKMGINIFCDVGKKNDKKICFNSRMTFKIVGLWTPVH